MIWVVLYGQMTWGQQLKPAMRGACGACRTCGVCGCVSAVKKAQDRTIGGAAESWWSKFVPENVRYESDMKVIWKWNERFVSVFSSHVSLQLLLPFFPLICSMVFDRRAPPCPPWRLFWRPQPAQMRSRCDVSRRSRLCRRRLGWFFHILSCEGCFDFVLRNIFFWKTEEQIMVLCFLFEGKTQQHEGLLFIQYLT